MLLIPQIYLKNGNLIAPEGTTAPIFQKDPMTAAKFFKDAGALGIFCIDLSIAPVGTNPNLALIKKMRDELDLAIYVTGSFKTIQELEIYFKTGIDLAVLGPIAYQKPDFLDTACSKFSGKIGVHIDVKGSSVTIPGYAVVTNKSPLDYAEMFKKSGVRYIFYSDVSHDGKIKPENLLRLAEFCKKTNLRIVCTSEIQNLEEIEKIARLEVPRLEALVLAKSLYEGRVDLRSTITMVTDIALSTGESTLTEM